ncbi:MAG: DUF4153 domain-containing protein [Gemmatimonadota bacterium]
MSRILAGLQAYAADARAALRYAPVEVAMGWLIAASASWAIAVDNADVLETWTRLGIAVAIALFPTFGASILRAADAIPARRRWLITAFALAVGSLYGAFFFQMVLAEAWRSWLLVGASAASLALVPILMPRSRDRAVAETPWNALSEERGRFWIFSLRVLTRVTTVYGMAILLAIGLSVAIAAVDTLFDLSAADVDTYLHLFSFVVIGVGTWAMAGGAPELAAEVEVDRELALVRARRLGLYLLLPLLLVYTGILYAYMVRMAVLQEVPQNLVSPLVLVAGALWLIGALVLEPFHWLEEPPLAARIVRVYPWVAIPLVALGGWALWLRVEQYAWTEFRFVRMMAIAGLGALAIVGIVRSLKHKPPLLREIPLTVSFLLLVSAVGPWGAPASALRSQRARLAELAPGIESAAADTSATTRAPSDEEESAANIVRYLRDHFGEGALEGVVSEPVLVHLERAGLLWGAGTVGVDGERFVELFVSPREPRGIPGVPGGTLYRFSAFQRGAAGRRGSRLAGDSLFAVLADMQVRLEGGSTPMRIDLEAATRAVLASAFQSEEAAPDDSGPRLGSASRAAELAADEALVPVLGAEDAVVGAAVIETMSVRVAASGEFEGALVTNVSGLLILSEDLP